MDMKELEKYRQDKDARMRGYEHTGRDADDRYTKDMFGGMQGIDPNSHGAELQ